MEVFSYMPVSSLFRIQLLALLVRKSYIFRSCTTCDNHHRVIIQHVIQRIYWVSAVISACVVLGYPLLRELWKWLPFPEFSSVYPSP